MGIYFISALWHLLLGCFAGYRLERIVPKTFDIN
jgi:hypothetical protein